jgi:hypothetical protein
LASLVKFGCFGHTWPFMSNLAILVKLGYLGKIWPILIIRKVNKILQKGVNFYQNRNQIFYLPVKSKSQTSKKLKI